VTLPDPFNSSRLLLARAKKDFAKLKRSAVRAVKRQSYEIFTEPDPDKAEQIKYKMRLTRELPDSISELTGHVLNNLRFALDHALSSVAVAAGCKKPRAKRNAYFPFSKDATTFESNLAGRCADVPKEMWPLLCGYQPYKGGEDFLVGLNEACNANKHDLVTPVGSVTVATGVSIAGFGFMSMPYPRPVWDRVKQEMELFTIHQTHTQKFNGNFHFGVEICFGDVGSLDGFPILPNLDKLIWVVGTILGEIEAEARRLGIIKAWAS
jgi:hypothetical protein